MNQQMAVSRLVLVLALALVLSPLLCVGDSTSYYVDSANGNDSNGGKKSTPFKTITKAVSAASNGDKVYLFNGTYEGVENYATVSKDVRIWAYEFQGATIVGNANITTPCITFEINDHGSDRTIDRTLDGSGGAREIHGINFDSCLTAISAEVVDENTNGFVMKHINMNNCNTGVLLYAKAHTLHTLTIHYSNLTGAPVRTRSSAHFIRHIDLEYSSFGTFILNEYEDSLTVSECNFTSGYMIGKTKGSDVTSFDKLNFYNYSMQLSNATSQLQTFKMQRSNWTAGSEAVVGGVVSWSTSLFDMSVVSFYRAQGKMTDMTFNGTVSGVALSLQMGTEVTVSKSTFSNNVDQKSFGGAVEVTDGSYLHVEGCDFFLNGAAAGGGAIYLKGMSSLDAESTTFNGNQAQQGGAIYCTEWSKIQLDGNLFKNNTAVSGACIGCNDCTIISTANDVFEDNHEQDHSHCAPYQ